MEFRLQKKVKFRCRGIKSESLSKLNASQIKRFKKNKIPQRNSNLKIIRPSHPQKQYQKQATNLGKFENHSSNESLQISQERDRSDDGDSKMTEKVRKSVKEDFRLFFKKIEGNQQNILQILKALISSHNSGSLILSKQKSRTLSKNSGQGQAKKQFEICQVLNEKIQSDCLCGKVKKNIKEKRVVFESDEKQKLRKQIYKLDPSIAKILLDIFMDTSRSVKNRINGCDEIKTIVSLRFFAKNMIFSDFLENLLSLDESISLKQLRQKFQTSPWLLNDSQISLLFKQIYQHQNVSNEAKKVKISLVARAMRQFVQDYPLIPKDQRGKMISQVKKFLVKKREQILSCLKSRTSNEGFLPMRKLETALKKFRLKADQILLLKANICVKFESISELPFSDIFSEKWINEMI